MSCKFETGHSAVATITSIVIYKSEAVIELRATMNILARSFTSLHLIGLCGKNSGINLCCTAPSGSVCPDEVHRPAHKSVC